MSDANYGPAGEWRGGPIKDTRAEHPDTARVRELEGFLVDLFVDPRCGLFAKLSIDEFLNPKEESDGR